MAQSKETIERNRDVARLRAIGLYTNKQIARALHIDESTVSHIYHERTRAPNTPIMTLEEVARMEDVNLTFIEHLSTGGHILTGYGLQNIGRDIHGNLITTGINMTEARGIGKEWVSVEEASRIARMQRPRGMYNRVLKGQVVSVTAQEGKAFHIGDQKGLKIIVKKDSIEPAKKNISLPGRIEQPPAVKQPEFTMVVIRPGDKRPIIIVSDSLSITIKLSNPEEGWVHEVLKLDVDLLPGARPQVRTRSYAR